MYRYRAYQGCRSFSLLDPIFIELLDPNKNPDQYRCTVNILISRYNSINGDFKKVPECSFQPKEVHDSGLFFFKCFFRKSVKTACHVIWYLMFGFLVPYLEGRMSGLMDMACPSLIKQGPSLVKIILEKN